jgi:uncharacterized protein
MPPTKKKKITRQVEPHVANGKTGVALGVLVKPASADCNLNCEYCFYHQRSTDPYAQADRTPALRRMSLETLERMVGQLLPLAGPQPNFGWQGGEPTLAGLPFFEHVVRKQQELKEQHQTISNALQTNAILLDKDWAQFLREHRFLVGVSIDGPQELHDKYRFDYGDNETFSRVMKRLDLLREHKVEFNLLCVVNRLTADRPEQIYEFLTGEGFQWLQFIPAVERDKRGRITPFSVTAKQYGNFLCRMFDCWYSDGEPKVSVRLFDELVGIGAGQPPGSCQLNEVCGGLYVVVEHNGDVYPCDFFVESAWRVGNLVETPLAELVAGPVIREFAQIKPNAGTKCAKCRWQGICRNGCPHYRSLGNGTFLDLDYLCEAYYRFYTHAIPKLQKLLQAYRADGRI